MWQRPCAEAGRPQVADFAGFCEGAPLLSATRFDPDWPDIADACCPTAETMGAAVQHFFDLRKGDVASGYFLGRPNQLRSIRWGSGILLEAIAGHRFAEIAGSR